MFFVCPDTFVFVLFFVLLSIFLCVYLNLGRKGSIHLVTTGYTFHFQSFSSVFLQEELIMLA